MIHHSIAGVVLAWHSCMENCVEQDIKIRQIGGAMQLVQYWAWARFPFLYLKIEPPLGFDYGPTPKASLAFK